MLLGRLNEHAGGGERAAVGLATSLPPDQFEVVVCTTRQSGGEPVATLARAGVRHVDLGRTHRFDVRAPIALVRLLRREHFDVLHAHMFGANAWAAVLGRLARVPVVIAHEQTWSYEGRPLRRIADAAIGRLVHAFVAVSSRDAERMAALERVPAGKIEVIPNAWVPRDGGATGDLRPELGLPADTPLIATVAILRPQKRLDVLLEAFVRVLATVPEARLVIVGDGEERDDLQSRTTALGIQDSVRFTGVRQDVATVWRSADVAALSSDYEGTPLSVLEAMAAGVPLVATEVGGMRDIAGDDGRRHGVVLVPRRDPDALGSALVGLLTDPTLRRQLGEAARARAGDFTGERHAQRCADLYLRLLARPRRRRSASRALAE